MKYRVYREREQTDAEGRDWADYLGAPRTDETRPKVVTHLRDEALRALAEIRDDASMGGHRYGRVEAGRGRVVAHITRRGEIVVRGEEKRPC